LTLLSVEREGSAEKERGIHCPPRPGIKSRAVIILHQHSTKGEERSDSALGTLELEGRKKGGKIEPVVRPIISRKSEREEKKEV